MIEWLISAFATGIAVIALLLNVYWKLRSIQRNDLKHLDRRIDNVEQEIGEIKERLVGVERDVAWMKKNAKTANSTTEGRS